jgi:hypothetical protein
MTRFPGFFYFAQKEVSMDLTMLIPGSVIGLLLLIMLSRRFKLIKKPRFKHINWAVVVDKFDNFILNLGFIAFFWMVFVGIWGFDWRIACIICGAAGLWFCFPRGEGK